MIGIRTHNFSGDMYCMIGQVVVNPTTTTTTALHTGELFTVHPCEGPSW
jgi:hypothetical protein